MLYFASDRNVALTKRVMEEFETNEKVKMPEEVMAKIREIIKGTGISKGLN